MDVCFKVDRKIPPTYSEFQRRATDKVDCSHCPGEVERSALPIQCLVCFVRHNLPGGCCEVMVSWTTNWVGGGSGEEKLRESWGIPHPTPPRPGPTRGGRGESREGVGRSPPTECGAHGVRMDGRPPKELSNFDSSRSSGSTGMPASGRPQLGSREIVSGNGPTPSTTPDLRTEQLFFCRSCRQGL